MSPRMLPRLPVKEKKGSGTGIGTLMPTYNQGSTRDKEEEGIELLDNNQESNRDKEEEGIELLDNNQQGNWVLKREMIQAR